MGKFGGLVSIRIRCLFGSIRGRVGYNNNVSAELQE